MPGPAPLPRALSLTHVTRIHNGPRSPSVHSGGTLTGPFIAHSGRRRLFSSSLLRTEQPAAAPSSSPLHASSSGSSSVVAGGSTESGAPTMVPAAAPPAPSDTPRVRPGVAALLSRWGQGGRAGRRGEVSAVRRVRWCQVHMGGWGQGGEGGDEEGKVSAVHTSQGEGQCGLTQVAESICQPSPQADTTRCSTPPRRLLPVVRVDPSYMCRSVPSRLPIYY